MSFVAKIDANIDQFEKKLDEARSKMDSFSNRIDKKVNEIGSKFQKIGGAITIGLVGSLTAASAAAFNMAKSVSNLSSDLSSLSDVTGATTDMLQEYRHVANMAGVAQDTFSDAGERLLRRLRDVGDDSSKVSRALASIGVSTKDASGQLRSSADIINDTVLAMSDLEGGINKSNLGVQLFGRGWKNVAPLVSMGSDEILRLRKEAHDLGLVLSEDALAGADKLRIGIAGLQEKMQGLKNKLGAELAPLLMDTLIPFMENRVVPVLTKIADKIGNAVKAFNSLSPAIKNTIISVTGFAAALGPVLLGLGTVLKAIPLVTAGFAALTGPVGIAIAAIAGAGVLIAKNWDKITQYFTSGSGRKLYDAIKNLGDSLKTYVTRTFENIKSIALSIWNTFGRSVTNIFKATFDTVITVIDTAVNTIANVFDVLAAVIRGDLRGALDGLKNLFSDIFKGIVRIVSNAQSAIASALSGLFRAIGLDRMADKLDQFNERVTPALQNFETKTKEATEAVTEQSEEVEKLTNTFKLNTSALDANAKKQSEYRKELEETLASWGIYSAQMSVINRRFNELNTLAKNAGATVTELATIASRRLSEGLGVTLDVITGKFRDLQKTFDKGGLLGGVKDASSIVIPATVKVDADFSALNEKLSKLRSDIELVSIEVGNYIADSISGLMSGIGEALAMGENIFGAIGKSLVRTLGDLAVQVGKQMIAFGTAAMALKVLLNNPIASLAAGAALVALGSAARSAIGNTMSSATSGGYSSVGSVSRPFEIPQGRGALYNNDRIEVDFVLRNGNLVGAMKYGEDRNKRLG